MPRRPGRYMARALSRMVQSPREAPGGRIGPLWASARVLVGLCRRLGALCCVLRHFGGVGGHSVRGTSPRALSEE